MKTKLLPVVGFLVSSMFVNSLQAQEYQPIPLSGFNADVIANGVGTSATSTNNDVDGVSYNFISRDFQLTATSTPLTYGLPTNGIITTAAASTAGLQYQLAPYSSNNSLRLETAGSTGTLTLSTPTAALGLYMLATGGSGACTVDVTVNFSDTTTQTFTGLSISDWYGGSNYAIQGIGRINRTNDNLESGNGTNPRLYQIPLAISAANQSKLIQSIMVTKTGTGGIPNIFAFSADLYTSCPAPTNFTSTTTMNGASINWTAPSTAPSAGYQYYLTTSSTAPTATTTPTGSVAAGTTSLTLPGLQTGQTYNLWVRSNCGTLQGFWKMTSFTTGQISVTYTAGDINTEYNSTGLDTTSTTSCPGTMSITIPAGYKINSTSVSYNMSTAGNGWMSEQKSILVCSTNGNTESAISSGSGSNTGTFSYNRTGLALANDLTGTVNFDLRTWRTYGGSGCSPDYNKVDNNTWKVTVTLAALPQLATAETQNKTKEISAYPNPFQNVLNIKNHENIRKITITDFSGIAVKSIDKPSSSIQLSDLKAGVYILTSIMNDGSVKSMKIIKK
ncbi:T9SS type A sorting domain-containing protein [Chryseobacterium caseinilyticum]|uniref:T9SS type A sorting domain-containing protein n=1 Tax=Chryseobacterium caseinilyticum TaxID=2771428 RepID=A0ABR8ZDW1_9FLAO|nr:T9SS type A sorting domain-containing protein [Chryseobacterium caseinilyticum]MBD8083460.1 T9SS type A sorting domain-containing protein [Chryseobacterium caseinilyticum]